MSTEILDACIQKIIDAVFALIQDDPHQWSDRPCGTCRSITALAGKPFGCYEYQRKRSAK